MANISKIGALSGFQGTDSGCEKVSLYDLRNYIDTVTVAATSGSGYVSGTTAAANSPFALLKNFECGTACYFYRKGEPNSWSVFNVAHLELGNLASNAKRMTTLYPEQFTITGKGTFHLTTGVKESGSSAPAWYSTHPVYMTTNRSLKCWFDGSTYVISSVVGNKSGSVVNNSVLPNAPYGSHETSSSTIQVTGFTGGSSNANGLYAEVGYINKNKLYRHAGNGNFYYFNDGSRWALTDTPITTSGTACHINGGTSVSGKLDNSNGSNGRCFDGQVGSVSDGSVDSRSLGTEDELSIMATEDKESALITEENK